MRPFSVTKDRAVYLVATVAAVSPSLVLARPWNTTNAS